MAGTVSDRFSQLPFRTKLTSLMLATAGVALLMSCFALIILQYQNERASENRRYTQVSDVLAANLSAAVIFGDRSAASESLASVSGIPEIEWIDVFNGQGQAIASYVAHTSPAHQQPRQALALASAPRVNQATVEGAEIHTPIIVHGDHVGDVVMRVKYITLGAIVQSTALSAAFVFLACLTLAWVVARMLRAMVFRPLERLTNAMQQIGDSGDFSMRLARDRDPDFNLIIGTFNTMLTEIETQNTKLSDALVEVREARDAEQASLAKSQFMANMSHELRTPLNAIIGYTEVLREDLDEAGYTRSVDDVRWIHSSAQQLLVLINSILDLSKIDAGRMDIDVHEFDVTALLTEVKGILEPMATQNHNKLNIQVSADLDMARNDSSKLRQCLLNLGSNACKFTENGHVFIFARRADDILEFQVSDTGIGMQPDEMSKLFQPFVQGDTSTTRKYGGTGLGLTITKHLAELMGGEVTASSTPGEGSVFTLSIKADASVVPAIAPESVHDPIPVVDRPQVGRDGNRPLALIIDDEPSAAELLRRLVEQSGYDVVTAMNGEEGLSCARKHSPDLILLDIDMPKIDGWQVLDALEEDKDLQSIPTVIVSVDDNRRKTLDRGACDHLVKPVNREEFGQILSLYSNQREGVILIVEDDEATAKLYMRTVSQIGFTTLWAANGIEALAALESAKVSLVVTDLRLPLMDGFQLVDTIAKRPVDKRPPVMVVTGHALERADIDRMDGKIVQVLTKNGLSPRALATNIASHAERPVKINTGKAA